MSRVRLRPVDPAIAICWLLLIATTNTSVAEYDISRGPIAQANGKTSVDQSDAESRVADLVKSYLPELRTVLASLKKHSDKEYQKAINDLTRTARRLESLKQRDAVGFELEVALLQWQTRADLAMAQLQIRDNVETRDQLKTALKQREQAKLARARHERERLTDRIQRLQTQLDRLDNQLKSADVQESAAKAYATAMRRLDLKQSKQEMPSQTQKTPKSKSDSATKSAETK